jgi:hypothetical protein
MQKRFTAFFCAMPTNPNYNDATLHALVAYFRTFQSPEKP